MKKPTNPTAAANNPNNNKTLHQPTITAPGQKLRTTSYPHTPLKILWQEIDPFNIFDTSNNNCPHQTMTTIRDQA